MAAPYSRPAAAAELIRLPTVAPASAPASIALSVSGMSGTRDATEPAIEFAMSDAAFFNPVAVAEAALLTPPATAPPGVAAGEPAIPAASLAAPAMAPKPL